MAMGPGRKAGRKPARKPIGRGGPPGKPTPPGRPSPPSDPTKARRPASGRDIKAGEAAKRQEEIVPTSTGRSDLDIRPASAGTVEPIKLTSSSGPGKPGPGQAPGKGFDPLATGRAGSAGASPAPGRTPRPVPPGAASGAGRGFDPMKGKGPDAGGRPPVARPEQGAGSQDSVPDAGDRQPADAGPEQALEFAAFEKDDPESQFLREIEALKRELTQKENHVLSLERQIESLHDEVASTDAKRSASVELIDAALGNIPDGKALPEDKKRLRYALEKGPSGTVVVEREELTISQAESKKWALKREIDGIEEAERAKENEALNRGEKYTSSSPPFNKKGTLRKLEQAIEDSPDSVVYFRDSDSPPGQPPVPKQILIENAQAEYSDLDQRIMACIKAGLQLDSLKKRLGRDDIEVDEFNQPILTDEDKEKLKEHSDEIVLENADLIARLRLVKAEVETKDSQIGKLKAARDEANREKQKLGGKLESTAEEKIRYEQEATGLRESIKAKEDELGRTKAEVVSQRAELEGKTRQIAGLNERIGTVLGSHDQALENEKQTREVAETQKGELGKTREALESERGRSASLDEQLAAQREATQDAETRAADADELRRKGKEQGKTISSLTSQLDGATASLESQATRSKSAKRKFDDALAAAEERLKGDYDDKLRKEKGEKAGLKSQVKAGEERASALEAEVTDRDSRVDELTKARAELEETNSGLSQSKLELVNRVQGMYEITNGIMELIALISHPELSEQEERYQSILKELIGHITKEEAVRGEAEEKRKTKPAKPREAKKKLKRITISEEDLATPYSEFKGARLLELIEYVPPVLAPGLKRLYERQNLLVDLQKIRDTSPEKLMTPEGLKEMEATIQDPATKRLIITLQTLYQGGGGTVKKTPMVTARRKIEDTPQGMLYRSLLYNMIKVVSGNEWKALVGTDPSIPDYYKRDEFKSVAGIFAEFSKKIEESQAGKSNEMQLELEKMAAELEEKDRELAGAKEESAKVPGLETELETARKEYESYTRTTNEETALLKTNVQSLEEKLAAKETEVVDLNGHLEAEKKKYGDYVAETSTKIQEFNRNIKAARKSIGELTAERDGLAGELEQERKKYVAYDAEKTAEISALNGEKDGLSSKVDELTQELDVEKTKHSNYVAETSEKIQDLNARAKGAERKAEALTAERDGLAGELEQERKKYVAYDAEKTAEISALNGEKDGLSSKVDELTQELGRLRQEREEKEAGLKGVKDAFAAGYGSRDQVLARLDDAIGAGVEEARIIKEIYTLARRSITHGSGEIEENEAMAAMLDIISKDFDVSTEMGLFGHLEYAKWLSYEAKGLEDHGERMQHYNESIKLLERSLTTEPAFRGAQIYIQELRNHAETVDRAYSQVRDIMENGIGRGEEGDEALRLLKSIEPLANVGKEKALIGALDYAKWLTCEARNQRDRTARAELYTQSIEVLRGILSSDPKYKAVERYMELVQMEYAAASMP